MKRQLERILQIRELMEDLSRLDFERRTAELRYLELASERQSRLFRSVRESALQMLAEEDSSNSNGWLIGLADAEIAGWKEARLHALSEAERPAVDRAREEMLTRRQERRQLDILNSAAAHAQEKRQIRQEQNQTDDWFQSRPERAAKSKK
ncbi:MAG TPA: hypothetical protein VGF88_01930 [Acidobacteriaceae bacterium]|jgi:hypothetical protein